jgi:hypothetical protein
MTSARAGATITPVLVTGRRLPPGPFVKRGLCPAGPRSRHAGSGERDRQAGLVARRLSGDERCGGAAAMHAVVQTAERHPRNFHPTTLVVRAFRSRRLRQAESHMHDCPVALGAHREAASLEHIQHRDVFRKDLGDELMKSGFTAKGCEVAHQR